MQTLYQVFYLNHFLNMQSVCMCSQWDDSAMNMTNRDTGNGRPVTSRELRAENAFTFNSRVTVALEQSGTSLIYTFRVNTLQNVYVYSVKAEEPNGFLACGTEQHFFATEAKNSRDSLNSRPDTYHAGGQRQGLPFSCLTLFSTKLSL